MRTTCDNAVLVLCKGRERTRLNLLISVDISRYPLSGYPDLSVNFMAAKNPGYLKLKLRLLRLFAKIVQTVLVLLDSRRLRIKDVNFVIVAIIYY